MRAVLNNTRKSLRRRLFTGIRVEYSPGVKWGILDCGDLVIHVFEKRTRNFYALERLWGDATIIDLHAGDFISDTEEESEEDDFL
jgi:ribosome-associated protein